MRKNIANASASTILRKIKNRKNIDYGIDFIDQENKKIINMINSRVRDEVAEFLKQFPHLETVFRVEPLHIKGIR